MTATSLNVINLLLQFMDFILQSLHLDKTLTFHSLLHYRPHPSTLTSTIRPLAIEPLITNPHGSPCHAMRSIAVRKHSAIGTPRDADASRSVSSWLADRLKINFGILFCGLHTRSRRNQRAIHHLALASSKKGRLTRQPAPHGNHLP